MKKIQFNTTKIVFFISFIFSFLANNNSYSQMYTDCNGNCDTPYLTTKREIVKDEKLVNLNIPPFQGVNLEFYYELVTCCTPQGDCKYRINLWNIVAYRQNGQFTPPIPVNSLLYKEAIKHMLKRSKALFGISVNKKNYNITIATPSCMPNQLPVFSSVAPCIYECCVSEYTLDETTNQLMINNRIIVNTPVNCNPTTNPNCITLCESHHIVTPENNLGPVSVNDLCPDNCYWRLVGNDVADENYLGTNNNKSLKIKTMLPNPILFYTQNQLAMTIFPNGKVSFGNDGSQTNNSARVSDEYLVGIKGKLLAEEVNVKLYSAWPDYVFDNNYNLLSLDELENQIKTKKSLPGIPSANELNTIPLGEMNVKLLEKIEELTLYLIQLKNQNQKLEDRIKVIEGK